MDHPNVISAETTKAHGGDQESSLASDPPNNETSTIGAKKSNGSLENIIVDLFDSVEMLCPICQNLGTRRLGMDGRVDNTFVPMPLMAKARLAFFHEQCTKCSGFPTLNTSICSFCKHLRLWHLVFHALPEYGSIPKLSPNPMGQYFSIPLGDLAELRAQASQCGFCSFLAWHPEFSHLYGWTEIALLLDEFGPMIFADGQYRGRLRLEDHNSQTVLDNRRVQWDFIKDWLAWPQNQLSLEETPPGMIFHDFRLIDVLRTCVVRISEPTTYVALSYVWGNSAVAQFEATKRTISALEREGSLAAVDIPVTIRDAMIATKELGLRYLWVDRICIVQDDDDSKLHQIYRMDRIFASSHVTFVADGQDAMSGLPGIQVDRRDVVQTVQWNGLSVGFPYWLHSTGSKVTSSSHWHPGMSEWYKRGWTYQEAVVSIRLLYFTSEGVFLESKGNDTVLAEGGTHGPRERWSTYSHPGYYEATREISTRHFTHSRDILLAFQGILNWIVEKQCHIDKNHRFGLPFEEFDIAVQWDAEGRAPKRNPDKQQVFPSWSWASIEGCVEYVLESTPCGSLATWAFCEQSAHNEPYLVPVVSRPKSICDSWRGHKGRDIRSLMMIAWLQGCFARLPPFDFTLDLSPSSIKEQMDSHFPTYDDFWNVSRGEQWQKSMFSSDDLKTASLRPGRLMVHTQCALLDLEYNRSLQNSDAASIFCIKRPSGERIGDIRLSPGSQEILSPFYLQTRGRHMEFLALTADLERPHWVYNSELEYEYGGNYSNMYKLEFGYVMPVVKVMLIYRYGLIARRLGVGYVYLKSWGETQRELKTVILE